MFKRFTKTILIIICFIVCIGILTACGLNGNNTANGKSDGNETAAEYMKTPYSKDSVDDFMKIIGKMQFDGLFSGMELDKVHCYNVTPKSVSAQTDYKIFKFSDSCISLILIDNEVYEICESFGGFGFVNAVPWDYDENGTLDLLVSSSCGSGVHRSIISVFDATTKESVTVYNTAHADLFVTTSSPSFKMPEYTEMPIYYQVDSAKIEVINEENNFADLSYVSTGAIGVVVAENGKPVFKPMNTKQNDKQ